MTGSLLLRRDALGCRRHVLPHPRALRGPFALTAHRPLAARRVALAEARALVTDGTDVTDVTDDYFPFWSALATPSPRDRTAQIEPCAAAGTTRWTAWRRTHAASRAMHRAGARSEPQVAALVSSGTCVITELEQAPTHTVSLFRRVAVHVLRRISYVRYRRYRRHRP